METYNQFLTNKYDVNHFSAESANRKQFDVNKEKQIAEKDNQLALFKSLTQEIQIYKYANEIPDDEVSEQRIGNRALWMTGLWPFYAYAAVNFFLTRQNLFKSLTSPIGSGIFLGSFVLSSFIYQNYSISPKKTDLDQIELTEAMNVHLIDNVAKALTYGKH